MIRRDRDWDRESGSLRHVAGGVVSWLRLPTRATVPMQDVASDAHCRRSGQVAQGQVGGDVHCKLQAHTVPLNPAGPGRSAGGPLMPQPCSLLRKKKRFVLSELAPPFKNPQAKFEQIS
jgi:hypothetical protein